MITSQNPTGLAGIQFIEFASPHPDQLHDLFLQLGFSHVMVHSTRKIDLYRQHSIAFLINREPMTFANDFSQKHGPSLCSMGWRIESAAQAFSTTIERGPSASKCRDYDRLAAIEGVGGSNIYFCDTHEAGSPQFYLSLGFRELTQPNLVPDKGFLAIDHLTNNVEKGEMGRWASFYKSIFGFTEVRYFDIRGAKTGLTSYALRSPDGSFCIPINEGTEAKSQINEYLEEYRGAGVQHLAFLTEDILGSLGKLEGSAIQTLDIDSEYYQDIFTKIPGVTEDHREIQQRNVLIDGDNEGYLLQIFTKNLIGPIFIEIIQRKNHLSFGEGNFGALFRSIERDQMKRGYLK